MKRKFFSKIKIKNLSPQARKLKCCSIFNLFLFLVSSGSCGYGRKLKWNCVFFLCSFCLELRNFNFHSFPFHNHKIRPHKMNQTWGDNTKTSQRQIILLRQEWGVIKISHYEWYREKQYLWETTGSWCSWIHSSRGCFQKVFQLCSIPSQGNSACLRSWQSMVAEGEDSHSSLKVYPCWGQPYSSWWSPMHEDNLFQWVMILVTFLFLWQKFHNPGNLQRKCVIGIVASEADSSRSHDGGNIWEPTSQTTSKGLRTKTLGVAKDCKLQAHPHWQDSTNKARKTSTNP